MRGRLVAAIALFALLLALTVASGCSMKSASDDGLEMPSPPELTSSPRGNETVTGELVGSYSGGSDENGPTSWGINVHPDNRDVDAYQFAYSPDTSFTINGVALSEATTAPVEIVMKRLLRSRITVHYQTRSNRDPLVMSADVKADQETVERAGLILKK